MENFLSWWFDSHYIMSTVLTPGLTAAWCMFKGVAGVRFILALILWVVLSK